MNKFREAIKKTRKRDTQRSIGFGTQAPPKQRAMLLAIVGEGGDVSAALKAGADLGLVTAKDGSGAASAAAAVDGGAGLLGVAVETLEEGATERLAEAGVCVIAAPASGTSASAMDADGCGHVVEVGLDTDETTLKALGALSIDALSVDTEAAKLTLAQQLQIARLSMLSGRPLMVRVPADISVGELRVLRDSGVAVVAVPASTSAKKLTALGKALEEVPARKKADGEERHIAIVPGLGGLEADEE